jgi:hypothetical protein
MRILFALSSPEYFRFFDGTMLGLALHGHDVSVVVNVVRPGKPVPLEALAGIHERVSVVGLVPRRGDAWEALAGAVRGTQDFIRYLHPDLSRATRLRARAKSQALPWFLQPLDRIRALSPGTVAALMRWLQSIERSIPVSDAVARFLDTLAPDLVLVSPLVELRSEQVDIVRAAQARGTRVATLVASWDNLTNKGDLRVATDVITVWNEAQKREAIELHRVAPETVVVTGAQVFDRWFNRSASTTREAFCRQVGLPGAQPFLLYTGSSIFVSRAETEMAFVRRWIEALRSSPDPEIRTLAVLVRPHPYNGKAWRADVCADLPGVAVWPPGGFDPIDEANRTGFFDSMFHASAVIGINTSAMIEAAIVGRPVFAIELPDFAGSQDETLHYRHLLPENGGFLHVAATLDDHVRQLGAVLQNPERAREDLEQFVERFVRPLGLRRPATPALVEAIERCETLPVSAPARSRVRRTPVRTAALWPLARFATLAGTDSQRRTGTRRPEPTERMKGLATK